MKKIVVLFVLLSVVSCNSTSKPDRLISREEMVELLYELSLNHSLQTYNFNRDTIFIYQSKKDILAKYQLDSIRFEQQHDYYRNNLEDYSAMHKEVKEKIEKLIDETEKLPNDKEEEKESGKETISSNVIKYLQEN